MTKSEVIKIFQCRDANHQLLLKDMGINDLDAGIAEKLMLILGVRLSEYLCVEKRSHCRAVHYFFDCPRYQHHLAVALKAVELSPFSVEILRDIHVGKRLVKVADTLLSVEQVFDHQPFVEWFAGKYN